MVSTAFTAAEGAESVYGSVAQITGRVGLGILGVQCAAVSSGDQNVRNSRHLIKFGWDSVCYSFSRKNVNKFL